MAVGEEQTSNILDRAALLDRVGDDPEFLQELAQMFLEQRQRMLSEINSALHAGDAGALARAAHTLKGCIGNLGAEAAFQFALKLELLGRNGQLSEARQLACELESEVARFEQALLRLAQELRRA